MEDERGWKFPVNSFFKAHYLLLKDSLCRTGQERTDLSFLWLAAFLMTVDMNAPSGVLVSHPVEAQIGKYKKNELPQALEFTSIMNM